MALAKSHKALCGTVSNAFAKSSSACANKLSLLPADSASQADVHVARVAALPAAPKSDGWSCSCSQRRKAVALARIQTRTTAGKRPMGLRPPSALGSKQIRTSCQRDGHLPLASQSFKRSASLWRIADGSSAMALGAVLSTPTPVLVGKERAASLMSSPFSGGMSAGSAPAGGMNGSLSSSQRAAH